jgi:hypothetical protein
VHPIAFSANGSHALYAIDGVHNRTFPCLHTSTPGILNDYTDHGKLYDPIKASYFYKWSPLPPAPAPVPAPAKAADALNKQTGPLPPTIEVRDVDPAKTSDVGSFEPYDASHPVDFLYFKGRWGDQKYPNSDKRQKSLLNLAFKFEGGPTGPAWKDIGRKNVWPGDKGQIMKRLGP